MKKTSLFIFVLLMTSNVFAQNVFQQGFNKKSLTASNDSYLAKSINIKGGISGAKIDFKFKCVNNEIEVTAKNLKNHGIDSLGHFQEFFGLNVFKLSTNFGLYKQRELQKDCSEIAKIFENNQDDLIIKSQLSTDVTLRIENKKCMVYSSEYLTVDIENPKSFSYFADREVSVRFAAPMMHSSIQLPDAACEKLKN